MRNLWQFIVKNAHLLLFILLEVVALLLIISSQPYPQSTVLTSGNHVVAWFNQLGDDVAAYFYLRKDNELLNDEICRLQEEVQSLQNRLESYNESDWAVDTTYQYANMGYRCIPAKVIDLTTNKEHNYLTLNKGCRDGIDIGMGVIAGGSVVGVVQRVNASFAQVVPLIHTQINLSARVRQSGQIGFTNWTGHDPSHVNLREIGRHKQVQTGDTVVTSGLTLTFPEGILIGVMDEVELNEGDDFYRIRLQLSTDFHYLRYVQVLDNSAMMEQLTTWDDEQ